MRRPRVSRPCAPYGLAPRESKGVWSPAFQNWAFAFGVFASIRMEYEGWIAAIKFESAVGPCATFPEGMLIRQVPLAGRVRPERTGSDVLKGRAYTTETFCFNHQSAKACIKRTSSSGSEGLTA